MPPTPTRATGSATRSCRRSSRPIPAAQANVLALAEILAGEAEVLDELVESVLDGRDEIALSVLRAQPPALQRLIVQRLADAAAGEPAPGVARRAADVAALPDTGTASVDLPHRVRATAERGASCASRARRRCDKRS